MPNPASPSALFDAYYYAHDCGEPYRRSQAWLDFFNSVAERIISDLRPGSVLDAGCAMGFLVEALRHRNVEAWGIDISAYAIQNVSPDIQPFCRVVSILDPFPQPRYDLVVCIEILEHLPSQQADQAITNLCRHSDDILFSSTPYDYTELTHFNVQPPEYWAEMFARHGFFREVDFDASFITPWAARFTRRTLTAPGLVRNYERRFVSLWKENFDLRTGALHTRAQVEVIEKCQADLESEVQALKSELDALTEVLRQKETELDAVRQSRLWRAILWRAIQKLRHRLT